MHPRINLTRWVETDAKKRCASRPHVNLQLEGVMAEQSSIQFIENKENISLYIDTAKTFLNLSTGALALTITLRDKILGDAGSHISKGMLISWFCYLLTIGFSALYQYFAVKFLDSFSRVPGEESIIPALQNNPGLLYGGMLICFFIGSLFLIISALQLIP